MKMKNVLLSLFMLTSVTVADTARNAETLFDKKCGICHIKTRPVDVSSLVAPPVMGIMRHIKMEYPEKKSAVSFMVDYVLHPSKAKAVCMPQKIRRFGLMPSQKGNVTKSELEIIAAWMYDNFPPTGFNGRQGKGAKSGNQSCSGGCKNCNN